MPTNAINKAKAEIAAMGLSELVDHIEGVHHAYLRSELPQLDALCNELSSNTEGPVREIHATLRTLKHELESHMMKEEQILFPVIRSLDAGDGCEDFHCGTVAAPIRQMEHEHQIAHSALDELRTLTDCFKAPTLELGGLYKRLQHLDTDMHVHIHKEDMVLFPGAIALELLNRSS